MFARPVPLLMLAGCIAVLAGSLFSNYTVYLAGWFVVFSIILVCTPARSGSVTLTHFLVILLLFFTLRLLVPLKYSQLVGEDARNIVIAAQYMFRGYADLPQGSLEPLSVLRAFPAVPTILVIIRSVAGVPLTTSSIYLGPLISVPFLMAVAVLSSRKPDGKPIIWFLPSLIVAVFPAFVYWQMMFLPQTLALALMGVSLLLMSKKSTTRRTHVVTSSLLVVALVVSHHITSFVLALGIMVADALSWFLHRRRPPGWGMVMLILSLAYWIYTFGGVELRLLVLILQRLLRDLTEPFGLVDQNYYRTGLFVGQPVWLAILTVVQVLAVVGAGLVGLTRSIRSKPPAHFSLFALGLFAVSAIGIGIGLLVSSATQPERLGVFMVFALALPAGAAWGLVDRHGSKWVAGLLYSTVIVLLLPVPFKVFRFVSDPPPTYLYQHIEVEETDPNIYARLVYKGDAFFGGARFAIAHAMPRGTIYADHSISREILVQDPRLVSRVRLFPDDLGSLSEDDMVVADWRFLQFLTVRESERYSEDPRLRTDYLSRLKLVYANGTVVLYLSGYL